MADMNMPSPPPPPPDNNNDDDDDAAAVAERARAKAEARRQRILEKARERMGVVAGERNYQLQDEQEEEAAAAAAASTEITLGSGGGGAISHRMQAMRRRRFKKTPQAKETKEEEKETTVVVKEKEVVAAEETTIEATASDASKDKEKDTAKVVVEEEETVVGSKETKKKYKGVAKMRREMLKKKEQEKQEAVITPTTTTTTTTATVPLLRKQPVAIVPILLHFVAVLLLFLAGLDIGWNQAVYSDIVVHREWTPTTNGIALVNRITGSKASSTVQDAFKLQETQQQQQQDIAAGGEEEFVETQEEEYIPNIDPIFQVDLDELTKGGGLFHTLARGAIRIHRLLLQIFYFLPASILLALLKIPQQLLATPPILCIMSLVIRQSIKILFGAKLPDPAAANKKEDVLAMMKQQVMNFLAGMFPTVVTAYDVWTHLRSDMYVILCGVLVGLVYTTHYSTYITGSGNDGKDEL